MRTPGVRRPRSWRRALLWTGVGLLALFAVAQVVPYGHSHSNPPVQQEPKWDSPATRALAARACFDCHSNLTKWRWYSYVAPASWLVRRDVDEGRAAFNLSEWNKPQDVSGGEIAEQVHGGMPPWQYTLLHSNATLSKAEKAQLIAGLQKTFANSPPIGGG